MTEQHCVNNSSLSGNQVHPSAVGAYAGKVSVTLVTVMFPTYAPAAHAMRRVDQDPLLPKQYRTVSKSSADT